jgi:hypothetical protein
MRDRTLQYNRPDAGETHKDIKTRGSSLKTHRRYENNENYRVSEIVAKLAQQEDARPLDDDERLRRKERVRRIIGTLLGSGYGTLAGGFVGGQVLGRGPGFDRQRAVKGMLLGLLGGGSLGYAGGVAVNKIQRYTGDHRPQPQAQTIQIIVPPDSNVIQQAVMDAGQGSKTAELRRRFRRFLSSV